MPTIQHSNLAGIELHEPKGADAASANTVYVFDGSGSGNSLPLEYSISGVIPDISTSSSILLPLPHAGRVSKVIVVLGGAITASDVIITVEDEGASTLGTLNVLEASSSEGDVYTLNLSDSVSGDSYLKVSTNGASNGSVSLFVTAVIEKI